MTTTNKIKLNDWTDVQVGDYWTGAPAHPHYRVTVVRVGDIHPSTMFPGEQYIEIEVEDFARRWTRRPFINNEPSISVHRPA
jgi:hypothetical protein